MPLSNKRILVAPLDWGLGHTTRCVPIIRHLQALGHTVVFAGNDTQKAIVRGVFPDLELHSLRGYEVRYGRHAFLFQLLRQVPGLLRRIREEHHWLLDFAERQHIDALISDNRYGLWHPQKPSVILTHQLSISSGMGKLVDAHLRKLHYSFLERFGQVWVPDLPGKENLAGSLAHPAVLPHQTHYIGLLSQLEAASKPEAKNQLLILLSGPEPQRSILSEKLWQQALKLQCPVVFVEGKPGAQREAPPHIRHVALADARMLQSLFQEAQLVVCRSGYSTLMDLVLLGKPALLIPTPGQTEQEYLARYHAGRGYFYSARQQDFILEKMLAKTAANALRVPPEMQVKNNLLPELLQTWLSSI